MSQSIDLDRSIASVITLAPAARLTGTLNGTGVDLSGFTECAAILACGVRTDGTHVIKLQDSPDNSAWTDIPAGQLSGAFAADVVSNTTVEVGALNTQRYVRAVATVSGTTTGAVYGVQIVRGGARNEPQ